MIGKVLRGTNAARLLYYLYGPGKANDHGPSRGVTPACLCPRSFSGAAPGPGGGAAPRPDGGRGTGCPGRLSAATAARPSRGCCSWSAWPATGPGTAAAQASRTWSLTPYSGLEAASLTSLDRQGLVPGRRRAGVRAGGDSLAETLPER